MKSFKNKNKLKLEQFEEQKLSDKQLSKIMGGDDTAQNDNDEKNSSAPSYSNELITGAEIEISKEF